MPIENFRVRKTTEHTGVQSEQLVVSALPTVADPTTAAGYKELYVDSNGIVYRKESTSTSTSEQSASESTPSN